jgi:regulator of sigma E protease
VTMVYVVGILGIAALILIHEAGHFLVARAFKMRVKKFSLGFFKPIVEWKPKGSETTYAIGSVPLGGYVQVDGLSPADEVDPADLRSYANQPLHAKLLMILAGPVANFLTAVVLFAVLFVAGIPMPLDTTEIGSVSEGEPAAAAGIQPGDVVLSIDGEAVATWTAMAERIHGSPGEALRFRLRRGGVEREVEVTPVEHRGLGLIGIAPATRLERRGPGSAIGSAFVLAGASSVGMLAGLWRIATCRSSSAGVAGPVGIVQMSAGWLREGWRTYTMFLAQISLSLFLFNFLPLPALDGGRMTFLAGEIVTRRRVSRAFEGYVHLAGFVLLLALLLVITLRDFRRLLP